MNFDKVFLVLGDFGPYQRRVCFWICLLYVSFGIQTMMSVFLLGVPEHRCAIPGLQDTYTIQSDGHRYIVDSMIPYETWEDGREYSQCVISRIENVSAIFSSVDVDYSAGTSNNDLEDDRSYASKDGALAILNGSTIYDTSACDKWVYNNDVFTSTFTSKMNLVCGQSGFRTHAIMAFMFGFLVGAMLMGILADSIGRKKSAMFGILLHVGSAIPLAFSPNLLFFIALRFINGVSCGGTVSVAFVTAMEFVAPSKRVTAGITFQLFWAGGVSLLSGLAYLIRDWQHLHLTVAVPTLFFLSYFWLLPESPRWLLQKGRIAEAKVILKRAAKASKSSLPDDIFKEEDLRDTDAGCVPIWHLFASRSLAERTLIVWLNWLASYLAYLGLSLNAGSLAGNIYLNFFLLSIVEFVSYTFVLVFLDRFGRKFLYIVTISTGGLACLLTIFPVVFGRSEHQWITVVLAVIGKTGTSAASAIVWVYSAELFPTVVRTSAVGSSSMMGRVGGAISPYIADLSGHVSGPFAPALPLVIIGAVCVASGVFSLRLPETVNKHLPETIEDAQKVKRKSPEVLPEKV